MATLKKNSSDNWLDHNRLYWKNRKATSPVIDERWWVVDFWPETRYSDEYSDTNFRPSKTIPVSGYFSAREDAERFIENHDPAPGAKLLIKHQNKRRITTEEWVSW